MTNETTARIDRLRATRDRLERQLADPKTPAYSVAPLSNQLRLTDKELDKIHQREAAKDDGLPTTPEKASWLDFFRYRVHLRRRTIISERNPPNAWSLRQRAIWDEWEAAGFVVLPYPARDDGATVAEHRAVTTQWADDCRAELVRCLSAHEQSATPDPPGLPI